MKQLELTVADRNETGTSAANRMRKAGKIPGVVYGKSGVKNLTVDEKALRMLMRQAAGSAALVQLSDEKGSKTLAVVQELHRHPYKDYFMHIDFHEVDQNEEMHAVVPVHTSGESFGVKNEGGILEINLHRLDIKCLPKDLPEDIKVDISELKAGESIHISQLAAIPGVKFLGDSEAVVVSCAAPKKVAETTETAEGEDEAKAEESK